MAQDVDEASIITWMQGASPALDGIMLSTTAVATYAALWLILAFALICFPEHREAGIAIIVSVAIAFVVTDLVLKPLVGRERPFEVLDVVPIVDAPGSSSFPSGHTAYSFAAATALLLYERRWGIPALAFACLVGVSRVYLCMHWPTDVLAGAMVGAASALVAVRLVRRSYVGDLEAGG